MLSQIIEEAFFVALEEAASKQKMRKDAKARRAKKFAKNNASKKENTGKAEADKKRENTGSSKKEQEKQETSQKKTANLPINTKQPSGKKHYGKIAAGVAGAGALGAAVANHYAKDDSLVDQITDSLS